MGDDESPTSATRTRLSGPEAVAVAWLVTALLDAFMVQLTIEGPGAAWHHGLLLGHAAALGGLACLLTILGRRLVRRRWRDQTAVVFFAAWLADALVLTEDLIPRAGRLAEDLGGSSAWWLACLDAAFAITVASGFALARWLQPRIFRFVVVALALVGLGANHLVLRGLYPAVHLHVACLGTTVLAASFAGLPRPSYRKRWVAGVLAAVAGLVALASLVVPAPHGVVVRALSSPGSVLMPLVARAQAWWSTRDDAAVAALPERDDVPPGPRLVEDPIVIWISIDALRADVMADEQHRSRLPHLFALRDSSVWFTDARTPAPATHVALASMFSGKWFSSLYWSEADSEQGLLYPHRDPSPRLPELLAAADVTTATFHGARWFEPPSGLLGDVSVSRYVRAKPDFAHHHFTRSSRIVSEAMGYLSNDAHQAGSHLLFMHLLEAHGPYDLASGESPWERYLGELAIVDAAIAPLLEMDDPALRDRLVILVSADHGEAFGEHNTFFHATTLYEELVRVPLMIRLADERARRVDTPVSLMDLSPTLLDVFGATTPGAFVGESLVPHLRGEAVTHRRPIAMDSGRLMRAMVFSDGLKLIEDRRRGYVELYDLKRDPSEQVNLSDELTAEVEVRREVMRGYFAPRTYRAEGYRVPYRPP